MTLPDYDALAKQIAAEWVTKLRADKVREIKSLRDADLPHHANIQQEILRLLDAGLASHPPATEEKQPHRCPECGSPDHAAANCDILG
jgi:hypothetical protein